LIYLYAEPSLSFILSPLNSSPSSEAAKKVSVDSRACDAVSSFVCVQRIICETNMQKCPRSEKNIPTYIQISMHIHICIRTYGAEKGEQFPSKLKCKMAGAKDSKGALNRGLTERTQKGGSKKWGLEEGLCGCGLKILKFLRWPLFVSFRFKTQSLSCA